MQIGHNVRHLNVVDDRIWPALNLMPGTNENNTTYILLYIIHNH